MQKIPSWVADYEGLPFASRGRDRSGLDCWGLPILIYREQFGIALASHAEKYTSANRLQETEQVVLHERQAWTKVPDGAQLPGDLIVFTLDLRPSHIGVWLAPGEMLHIQNSCDSVIERYDDIYWGNLIEGFYRHPARAANGL